MPDGQAGALFSLFLSRSLARLGCVDAPLSFAGESGHLIDSNDEAHEADSSLIERERFAFDLVDGHWS